MLRTLTFLWLLLGTAVVIAQDIGNCGTPLKNSDKDRFKNAVADYEKKDYKKASETLRKIARTNPKCADVQFYLGIIGAAENNAAAIRKYFGKLLQLCPSYPDPRAHLYDGIIHYSDEDYEGAVDALNRYFDLLNAVSTAMLNENIDITFKKETALANRYLYWSQFLADAHRNQVPFNPTVMLGASSPQTELMPFMTHDGQEIYYIRHVPEESGTTYYGRELQHTTPMVCLSRWKDTSFDAGTPLPTPFNTHTSEGGITITADGKHCYLSASTKNRNGYNNFDLYHSQLIGGIWQPFENLGTPINNDRSWDAQPSISADGQHLYFASNRPGGLGGTDIWHCHRLPNGDWSRPTNMGSTINTAGNEKCPFIHADGHTFYFASDGWQGFGGYDMYFINLDDPTTEQPSNLGLPINGEGDDICIGVTANGTTAYYAGRHPVRGLGGLDILSFDLYPAARPEPMTFRQGIITSTNGKPLAATITIDRTATLPAVYLIDTSGRYRLLISNHETNLISVQAPGYIPFATIGLPQRTPGLLPDHIQLKPIEKHNPITLNINTTQQKLRPIDQRLLDIYIQFLLNNPTSTATIEAPNKTMAEQLYDYLLSKKLRPSRLKQTIGTTTTLHIYCENHN